MTPRGSRLWLMAVALSAAVPLAAGAQPAPAATSSLDIRQMSSGVVVTPEVAFTEVNDRQATLVGGSIGWLTDRRLLVAGAGYWLANRDRDFEMQYGGALVRWTFFADRPVALSTGVFAGFGTATLARPYGDLFGDPPVRPEATRPGRDGRVRFGGTTPTAETPVRIHDDYAIAEPQVRVVWSMLRWLRLDAGAGYRVIGASDLLGRQLRGPSASIALQFGAK